MLTHTPPPGPLTTAEFEASLASLARFDTPPFLAVAVSGGPDSLALAILADRWTRSRGGEICALTVDHRLRPESGAEIGLLHRWLSARAIRHEILVWSGRKPATGIQEAARAARYRLLAAWCREHACVNLVTAHHREDQIETHLIRGRARSGPDGLAGMSAIRELADCRVVRPLLGFPKERLLALLDTEAQPFITDPSNRNPAFERSHLRGAEGAIPSVDELPNLVARVRAYGLERELRERATDALLARAVSLHPAGFAVLDPGVVLAMPHQIADRALSAVTAAIGGALYPARSRGVARLRDLLGRARHHACTLGGCRFVWWRGRVLVIRELAHAAQPARLTAAESLLWDRRFEVTLPPDATGPLTIGHLGAAGVWELNRMGFRPRSSDLPRLLFPILPAAWDETGIVAVRYLGFRRERVAASPQFIFRPVNPLTQAGFAVV